MDLNMEKEAISLLLDVTIVNSFIILTSCDSKLSHWQFGLTWVRDLIQEAGRVAGPLTAREIRQAPSTSQLKRLDTKHNQHQLVQFGALCVLGVGDKNKIQVLGMQHKIVCHPMFRGLTHQTAFLRIVWHYNVKVDTHISIYLYYHWIYWTYIFQ
jgi:phage FluMu protein gp41